ncbi:MAG: hypothetical protein LBV41_03120 [Cytophagaceae bacterium]|jgi:hypothetical protein|nr:hypothetical protein [Cytophagaceae bacterium]
MKTLFVLGCIFVYSLLNAQDKENTLYTKHEVGFSIGIFPTIGFIDPTNDGLGGSIDGPVFCHTEQVKSDGGRYYNMYHLGAYTLNYNYHRNPNHSLGVSLSWVGKHIDRYWWYHYSSSWFGSSSDTVNGSGYKHYFTLQGNYRRTYYRQHKISLYYGFCLGITFSVRDKDILYNRTYSYLIGSESNARYYFFPAIHLNAFGFEIGKKYKFNMEFGLGTQGVLKTGFRYDF